MQDAKNSGGTKKKYDQQKLIKDDMKLQQQCMEYDDYPGSIQFLEKAIMKCREMM